MNTPPELILLWSLQGEWLGVDPAQVAEIASPVPLQPIPLAPPYLCGIAPLHGLLTPVLDVPAFLGNGRQESDGGLLVAAPEVGRLALRTGEIGRIVPVSAWEDAPDPDDIFSRIACLDEGTRVPVLDFSMLVGRVAAALTGV